MHVTFYKCRYDKNVVNKNFQTGVTIENVRLKDDTNIMRPVLILNQDVNTFLGGEDISSRGYNYMYIPKFDRYYYIDATILRKDLIRVEGYEDVLMSHLKPNLGTQKQFITRIASTDEGQSFVPEENINLRVDKKLVLTEIGFVDIIEPTSYFIMCTAGCGERVE